MYKIILVFVVSILVSNNLFAYNQLGHRIIGKIAQMNLNKKSVKKLKKIMGERELDEVSNWPDEIKSDPLLATPQNTWHYVNIKGEKYVPLRPEDTYDIFFKKYPKLSYEEIQKLKKPNYKEKKGNLIWAIKEFRSILKDKTKSVKQRKEAIKFLAHFIGDLHQPLHMGYAHDRGGNSVHVTWNGKDTNLHAVWDTSMLQMSGLSYTEYTKYIYKKAEIDMKKMKKGDLMDWAYESINVRDSLYDLVKKKRYEGKYKEYKYYYDFKYLLHQNLIKAGIRLAKILNEDL